jgi:hypothetical protein
MVATSSARTAGDNLPSRDTRQKVKAVLDQGIYWTAFYELPFAHHSLLQVERPVIGLLHAVVAWLAPVISNSLC